MICRVPPLWIPAKLALEILGGGYPGDDAARSICERANAGLVKARARLLMIDDQRQQNVELPAAFWWAQGMEALDQNWESGDFSTWIERDTHFRAFGVEFDFEGLREMLSVETASRAVRQISVSSNPAWMSAAAARRFLWENDISGVNSAANQLLDFCRLGIVPARAMLMQRSIRGFHSWTHEEREWDVPVWFWTEFTIRDASSQDWALGKFSGRGRTPTGSAYLSLSGVYFLSEAIDAMLPTPAEQHGAIEAAPRAGGRPRKEWWDDLWCAVWGQAFRGDLQPKTQADIERAMSEWLIERGETASESTLKPLARKMFLEMQK